MRSSPYFPLFLLLILAVIWGSSFILMKKGLEVYTGTEVGTMRMFISFLLLLPFTVQHIKKVDKKYWRLLALVGLTGNGIPAILFAVAQTKINSSTAGVLNSLTPIFALLIAYLFFRQRFTSRRIAGVMLGLGGAVTLILVRANGTFEVNYEYSLLIVLATICYGVSVNLIKNYLNDLSSVAISSLALVAIGPPYGYYLLAHTDFISKMSAGGQNLYAFLFVFILASLGTALSLILFNKLVQATNVIYASTVTYLIPIVAFMWGVIDGEPLGLIHVVGMGAILLGIYLANREA